VNRGLGFETAKDEKMFQKFFISGEFPRRKRFLLVAKALVSHFRHKKNETKNPSINLL